METLTFNDVQASLKEELKNDDEEYSYTVDRLETKDDPFLNYKGPTIPIYNLYEPLMYSEIISNFLHRWIPDARTELEKPREMLIGDTNLAHFIENLKTIYRHYHALCQHAYLTYREEIDKFGKEEEYWYNLLKMFLEQHNAQIDADQKFKILQDNLDKLDGSLVDIEGYLGIGLFFVVRNPDSKQITTPELQHFLVLPTLGDYGHFLPEPGFSLVLKYGLGYFFDTQISGFQIGHLRTVYRKDEEGDYRKVQEGKPLYLETSLDLELDCHEMEEIVVEDVHLYGYLTTNFV